MEEAALKQQFWNFLQRPEQLSQEASEALLERYPYSHTLWLLEAKRQHLTGKPVNTSSYHKAALFCKNPDQLYAYLHTSSPASVKQQQEEIIQEDAVAKLEQLLGKNDLKETTAQLEEADEKATFNKDLAKYDDELMPYTFVWWLHKTRLAYSDTYQPYVTTSEKPNLKQLEGNISDIVLDHQIRENIFHLQSPEEKLSVKESKTVAFKISHKSDAIIDRFIKEEPQIKPPQASKITLENKARQSAEDQSTFVTETLALIYAEQGLYHKAIDTYQKLSLKYPEKSAYFADRISILENKLN